MSTNPYDSPRALDAEVKPASAKSLVTLALVSLHISAVLYCLVGLIFPLISNEATLGAIMACFALALAAGVEVVTYGIRKRRFWAWIAGLIIFGIYLPSLFLPRRLKRRRTPGARKRDQLC
jgi:Flp pilus assembly protein protease CpaA